MYTLVKNNMENDREVVFESTYHKDILCRLIVNVINKNRSVHLELYNFIELTCFKTLNLFTTSGNQLFRISNYLCKIFKEEKNSICRNQLLFRNWKEISWIGCAIQQANPKRLLELFFSLLYNIFISFFRYQTIETDNRAFSWLLFCL